MSKYFYYHLLIFGFFCYIVYNITYFSRFLPFLITKSELDFIYKLRFDIIITSILVFMPLLIKNIYKLKNSKSNNKISREISLLEAWEQSYEYNIKDNPINFKQKILSCFKNYMGIILTSCYVFMNYNFILIVGMAPSTGITDYLIFSNYIAWGIIFKGLFIPLWIGVYIYCLYRIDKLYFFYFLALGLLFSLPNLSYSLNLDLMLILKDPNIFALISLVTFVSFFMPYQEKLRFNGGYTAICIIVTYIAIMPLTSNFFRKSFYHELLQANIISENGININKKRFKNCEVPLVQVKIGDNYQLYCRFHNNYIRNSYLLLDGVPKFITQQIYSEYNTPEIIKIYNGDTMLNRHHPPLN